MKNIIIVLILSHFSCMNIENKAQAQQHQSIGLDSVFTSSSLQYVYEHMNVHISPSSKISMKFSVVIDDKILNGEADLVRLEGVNGMYIPEGTDILDDNTMEQYTCDSTYSYKSDSVTLTFAIENVTRERLSFIVSNSKIIGVDNEFYTLYLKK